MKGIIKPYALTIVLISLLIMFSSLSFSQEVQQLPRETKSQETKPSPQPETPEPETAELPTQWVWGEVISVDMNSGQILVKYMDYETDSEKHITISTQPETTFENVATLAEIKPIDTVSVDYIITSDGKNIAKNISIEKLEASPTESTLPSESEEPQQ